MRELVARRVPLYRFVLGNVVSRYDLDRADGRIDALREAAKLVPRIRDRSKVDAFARELAGMVGVDVEEARAEVRRAARAGPRAGPPARPRRCRGRPQAESPAAAALPDLRDPRFALERETLKLVVQHPERRRAASARDVDDDDFTHPTYRAVWEAVAASAARPRPPADGRGSRKLRDAQSRRPGRRRRWSTRWPSSR